MSFRDPVIMPGLCFLRHKGMLLIKHKLLNMGMTCSLFLTHLAACPLLSLLLYRYISMVRGGLSVRRFLSGATVRLLVIAGDRSS